ncbi:MAG TPA: 16S rRNA (guanine(527)-N(7))-methyltransferase RsmG [Bacteroidales bacterium]
MEIVQRYFTELSPRQTEQFSALEALYKEWNAQINVISRKDMDHFYERHVLHSLGIAKVILFSANTKVIDAGTGGGFPGIPLAIMFPESQFILADSIGKKIKVVQAVADALGLSNVDARHARVDEMKEKVDFVVSRAVTALPQFVYMAGRRINPGGFNAIKNGILYLKGGDFKEELDLLKSKSMVYNLSDYFGEPFFETKKLVHLSPL